MGLPSSQNSPFPPPTPGSRGLALVTGGAHRLGLAIATGLAQLGYALALHYNRSAVEAEGAADTLKELGVPVYPLPANLTDPAQVEDLFARVSELPHPLSILVNSAATMTRASLLTITPAEWDAVLALNLRAPLLCAQQAARLMPPGGVIINITDAGDQKAWTGYPAYTVSKNALEMLTRMLARSLGPAIRVNAVAPGLVLPAQDFPAQEWERLVARLPLKRAGTPGDIAQAVAFLVQNQYITGQTLVVDGGYQTL